LMAAIRL